MKMEYGKGINMKVNLRMIDSMEKVLILGQMEENILVHGWMAKKWDGENFFPQMEQNIMVDGKMIKFEMRNCTIRMEM